MNFCWHNYGKWSEAIESYGGSLHQVAKCKKCGAITRRKAISIAVAQLGNAQVNTAIKKVEE